MSLRVIGGSTRLNRHLFYSLLLLLFCSARALLGPIVEVSRSHTHTHTHGRTPLDTTDQLVVDSATYTTHGKN